MPRRYLPQLLIRLEPITLDSSLVVKVVKAGIGPSFDWR